MTNVNVFPDVHTEAVQAALAKHKERKMAVPMPSKRRSLVVQTSMDAYTPPGMGPLTFSQEICDDVLSISFFSALADLNSPQTYKLGLCARISAL